MTVRGDLGGNDAVHHNDTVRGEVLNHFGHDFPQPSAVPADKDSIGKPLPRLLPQRKGSLKEVTDVDVVWHEYVQRQKEQELENIINEERLKPEETRRFVEASFRDGAIRENGTEVAAILPPMSRFSKDRATKKETVLSRLKAFFERFRDIL